jgi:hypothetical protein
MVTAGSICRSPIHSGLSVLITNRIATEMVTAWAKIIHRRCIVKSAIGARRRRQIAEC